MRRRLASMVLLLTFAALPGQAQVVIDWVSIGNPGNFPDFELMTCCGDSTNTSGYGGVANSFQISREEITNAQYAEFLNAVAATDANGLYAFEMSPVFFPGSHGGIDFSGTSGSFSYTAAAGREDMPVNWVSFWDAIRFANWIHNGQPSGAQDDTTTEDGAYTITAEGITANSITRNPGAAVFVPDENEWYKAAYHSPAGSYSDYPTGTDSFPTCSVPGGTPNTANCLVGDVTTVGSYTGSASPYGTFDQGGNVAEWTETSTGDQRVYRGGDFGVGPFGIGAFTRQDYFPSVQVDTLGFRIARPAPSAPVPFLGPFGLVILAALSIGVMASLLETADAE